MRAYYGFVDDTGLRAFLPDDNRPCPPVVSGPGSAWIWAVIPEGGVTEIEAQLRCGDRAAALGLLQTLAVDLLTVVGPASPRDVPNP